MLLSEREVLISRAKGYYSSPSCPHHMAESLVLLFNGMMPSSFSEGADAERVSRSSAEGRGRNGAQDPDATKMVFRRSQRISAHPAVFASTFPAYKLTNGPS